MKSKARLLIAAGLSFFPVLASAAPRTSADYSISVESIDQGGKTLASADYSLNACANDSGAAASEATSGYLAKGGFIGQLFDVVGVVPTAASSTLNEGPAPAQPGSTLQLGASQVLDDSTLLPFAPSLAAWNVVGGPLAGIDANGLASAAVVYQDTPAVVRATYQGFNGTLNLTVLNVNNDDFGTYAGDGLPDSWQVQYFGLDNPAAAPTRNPDGTGQNNLFKYVAGLNPTDAASVFRVSLQAAAGQPGQTQIVFSPVVTGRTYTVFYKRNLGDNAWSPLSGAPQSDAGSQRTVTDSDAAGKSKFYRVQISKP